MERIRMKCVSAISLSCLCAAVLCAACVGGGAATPIDELIRRLGDDRFEVREDATRMLRMRDDAEPFLEKAVLSADPEIARRAKNVLEEFAKRRRDRALKNVGRCAKDFEVDKLVEVLTGVGAPAEPQFWHLVFDVAEPIINLERKEYGAKRLEMKTKVAPVKFTRSSALAVLKKGQVISAKGVVKQLPRWGTLLCAGEVDYAHTFGQAAVVCAGDVHVQSFQRVICFANGSVKVPILAEALVICDGDAALGSVYRSVVIARGKVVVRAMGNSTIFCGDAVEITEKAVQCAIVSEKAIRVRKPEQISECRCKQHVADATAPVRFFDPAKLGVELRETDRGIQVAAVRAGTRLGAGSVRVDDLILEIQGVPVKSMESCRRLLRRRVALDDLLTLRVRRSGTDVKLKIAPERR